MPTPREQFDRLLPWIRAQFPQLDALRNGKRRIYLDNAAGTLVPQSVAEAMADAVAWLNPQPGRGWPGSTETDREHARVRTLLAEFLNAAPGDHLYLSESTSASLYKLREALEPQWTEQDNLLVTDADHFANVSPWEWRARWEVRRVPVLPDGHLAMARLASCVDSRTRVAAITLAGNALGTITRVEEAISIIRARAPDAVIVIDAVHAAPHLGIDVATLGADALAFSTYKLFGPCCGVLWLKHDLLKRLQPYHVEPHTDPATLMEWGTLSNAVVGGIAGALEYLRRLGERLEPAFVGRLARYPRERRLFKVALAGIREHELALSRRVLEALAGTREIDLFGVTDPIRAEERVPTLAFALRAAGAPAGIELERALWDAGGIQAAASSHYSATVLRALERRSLGRASFAHYNTAEEADAFVETLRRVATA